MNKITDAIKEKIRLRIYNTVRQAYLKISVCNIGKIVEEEDKIICYVDQKSLDRHKGNYPIYKLSLNGMNVVTEGIKESVKNFKLDKPVYYIFENIEFKSALQFSSLWAYIIFRNCTFDKNIGIIYANDVTFENNKYSDHCPVYHYGNCFLTADRINKLTFKNERFLNSYELKEFGEAVNFGMKIDTELLEFIDTNIDVEYPATLIVNAKKTIIDNSTIKANEVYIDSKSISFTDSSITAQNGAMIENEDCDFRGNIQSPITYYNGVDLSAKNEESYKVDEEEIKLKEVRQILVQKLRNLSNICQQAKNNEIQTITEHFDSQPINKILKR